MLSRRSARFGRQRALVVIAILASGCGTVRPHAEPSPSFEVPPVAAQEQRANEATRRASCAITPPRSERRTLATLISVGEHTGKTWIVAQREPASQTGLLVHLNAAGRLVENELPALTELVAFEGARLHFLDYGKPSRWWSADVSNPDAPVIGRVADVPALGWTSSSAVKAFAVSGPRAFVSVHHVRYADGRSERSGESAFYDRATGQRLGPVHAMTAWAAECLGTRCAGIASENGGDEVQLVVFDPTRILKKTRLGSFGCSGARHWRDGDRWLLVFAEEGRLRALSVDLRTGKHTERSSSVLGRECGGLEAIKLGGRRGVVLSRDRFVPIDAEARIGAAQTFPELGERSHGLVPLPDGAAVADYSSDSWLKHGPTDSRGVRRYHREWKFSGRVGLVRAGRAGTWSRHGVSPLPGDGSEGRMTQGPDVALLSNGHYAAAIVTQRDDAEILLLSKPCAAP